MISAIAALLLAGEAPAQDVALCEAPETHTPFLFCLAEEAEARASRELVRTLEAAKAAALLEQRDYREWAQRGVESSFEIDEVEALTRSQEAWSVSMEADCALVAARFRRATTSAAPLVAELQCRSERLRARRDFLIARYELDADLTEPAE